MKVTEHTDYRRVHIWLEKQGIYRNPKTILRLIQKYNLLSDVRRKITLLQSALIQMFLIYYKIRKNSFEFSKSVI